MLVCLLKRVLSIAQLRQLLELQRAGGSVEHAYDQFCDVLEEELSHLRERGEQVETLEQGLSRRAVSAFVCKLAFEELLSGRE
jgi:DNA-binding transcriptional MerR regulator